MVCLPLYAPCNLAIHKGVAVIQYGGPQERQVIVSVRDCFVLPSLYEMAIHRLKGFQSGLFACRENGVALEAVERAYAEFMASTPEAAADLRVLDEPDPNAGGACHRYSLPPGSGEGRQIVQYQHGPRGLPTSVPGVYDDCILAILEHAEVILGLACHGATYVKGARAALAERVADRMFRGVLGVNEQ